MKAAATAIWTIYFPRYAVILESPNNHPLKRFGPKVTLQKNLQHQANSTPGLASWRLIFSEKRAQNQAGSRVQKHGGGTFPLFVLPVFENMVKRALPQNRSGFCSECGTTAL